MKDITYFAATKLTESDIVVDQVGDGALTSVLNTVYLWAGIVCVIVIIVGSIRYTASGGDPAGVQSGKNTIMYGLLGMVVVASAAGITTFISGRF